MPEARKRKVHALFFSGKLESATVRKEKRTSFADFMVCRKRDAEFQSLLPVT